MEIVNHKTITITGAMVNKLTHNFLKMYVEIVFNFN